MSKRMEVYKGWRVEGERYELEIGTDPIKKSGVFSMNALSLQTVICTKL